MQKFINLLFIWDKLFYLIINCSPKCRYIGSFTEHLYYELPVLQSYRKYTFIWISDMAKIEKKKAKSNVESKIDLAIVQYWLIERAKA